MVAGPVVVEPGQRIAGSGVLIAPSGVSETVSLVDGSTPIGSGRPLIGATEPASVGVASSARLSSTASSSTSVDMSGAL